MNQNPTSANRSYRCGACGDSSDNEREARIHAKKHTGVRFETLYPDAAETLEAEALPVEKTK